MFKGIFLADLHCSRKRKDDCLKVLTDLWNFVFRSREKIPVFICGDFWDYAITATENSGYSDFINAVHSLKQITDVYFIYGTPLHEPEKSLEVFKLMGCTVIEENSFILKDNFELVAIPEPRKSKYISKSKNGQDINELITEDIKSFINNLPEKQKFRIAMYHGEIKGQTYQNNLPCTSSLALNPKDLKKINADFIGCGHIHKVEEVFKNCWYLGSCPPKDFGEKHDASFFYIKEE